MRPDSTTAPVAPTSFNYWYVDGAFFRATKAIVRLEAGLLISSNAQTGEELFRYAITPDIKLIRPLGGGSVGIKRINNQEIKSWLPSKDIRKYSFYFYNPMWMLLSYIVSWYGSSTAKQFMDACYQAARAPQPPVAGL
jgi:hypothetical protein